DEAVTAIARISRGVPRVVNLVCDRALETGYEQQSRTVGEPHVSTAASLLELPAAENPIESVVSAGVAPAPDAASPSRRPLAALAPVAIAAPVGLLAIIAAAVWIGGRAATQRRGAEQTPAAVASPRPAVTPSPAPVAPPPRALEPPLPQSAPPKEPA